MPSYQGSCHCGQVEYTVEIPSGSESHVLCHCKACKMMSGGEFTENQIIPKDNFKLTKGKLSQYTYKGDSGNSVDCFFCGNCTSNPYHHQQVMGPDTIVVRTQLLKGSESWGPKPAVEIFTSLRPGWLPQTAENAFEGAPPS